MGLKENLIASVEKWRDIVVYNAKNDSLRALTYATVSSSRDIDKASGWVIGASGAIAGLIVSNIDKLAGQYFAIIDIKVMLSLLTISILCGLAEKSLAVSCAIYLKVSAVFAKKLAEVVNVFESHEKSIEDMAEQNNHEITIDFDFEEIMERYADLSPFYARWITKRLMKRSFKDPEYANRRVLRAYYNQNVWLYGQAISFICFVLAAIKFL